MNLGSPSVRIGGATLGFGVLGFALVQILRDIVVVALILVIVALAAVLVIMWLRQRNAGRAKQASREIESTLIKQADEDIGRSMPAQAASLENLKAELVNAIQSL